MVLSLSSHNVIQYLQDAGLCSSEDGASDKSELPGSSKNNFNLLVTLADNRKLLIKQERNVNNKDAAPHDLFQEWLFHQLLQQFPVLGNISAMPTAVNYAPLVVHFDKENSILVRNYLSEYLELAIFYHNNDIFPQQIASAIGTTLAGLHRGNL